MANKLKKITIKAHYDFKRDSIIMEQGCIMELRSIGFGVELKPRTFLDVARGEYPVNLTTPNGVAVKPKQGNYSSLNGVMSGVN